MLLLADSQALQKLLQTKVNRRENNIFRSHISIWSDPDLGIIVKLVYFGKSRLLLGFDPTFFMEYLGGPAVLACPWWGWIVSEHLMPLPPKLWLRYGACENRKVATWGRVNTQNIERLFSVIRGFLTTCEKSSHLVFPARVFLSIVQCV